MTTYTYRAIWEIGDPSRPLSALKTEACAALDVMAAGDGARIIGEPRWTFADRRLVCEAPAVPLTALEESDAYRKERRDAEVLRLAGLRWSGRQIASTTGLPHSTVAAILARHNTRPAATTEETRAA